MAIRQRAGRRAAPALLGFFAPLWIAVSGHAGTTIITHGFQLASTVPPAWTLSMAKAILTRDGDTTDCGNLPGVPKGTVFEYQPAAGNWQFECGSSTPNGERVLIFNWATESDVLTAGGTQGYAEAAADALYAALRDPQLPPAFASVDLLAPDIHFIGHSRGTVVNSDCVNRLAAAGIAVDHVTTLDPHPVDGTLDYPLDLADWLDRAPERWSNVSFADNYWRMDGGGVRAEDFDGMSLEFNGVTRMSGVDVDLDIGGGIEGSGDVDPPNEHSEVHAWYHGTIDLGATDDGDGIDIDAEATPWYDNPPIPARNATGFAASSIVGGPRASGGTSIPPTYSPSLVYNGDFEVVNTAGEFLGIGYAGWLYHGGNKPGALVPWNSISPPPGSSYYLTLAPGSSTESITHNRLYIDERVTHMTLLRRYDSISLDDRFRVTLIDEAGSYVIADWAIGTTDLQWHDASIPIPPERRGNTYAVEFSIVDLPSFPPGVEAIVDVDDIAFSLAPGIGLPGWSGPLLALLFVVAGAILFVLARPKQLRAHRRV